MFDALKERLETVFRALRGKGKLSEADISDALREVRRALLEADVHYKVAKDLVEKIRTRCTGADVLESITPAQQVSVVVYEELASLMGEGPTTLTVSPKPPTVYMMVGLQGSGKTTTAAKLAKRLSKGHRPLLVACDLQRPAAVEQLRVLAEQVKVPFFGPGEGRSTPLDVASGAIRYAEEHLADTILLDTAGRLHLDEPLMQELEAIRNAVKPHEILLVVDAMTGQEAVNVASSFHQRLSLTGVILSKLDGDARGGAALAVRAATGVPIKLAGVGEKVEDLEEFDARRMAQRIMGMGDITGLMEKVQAVTDRESIERMSENLRKNRFTMEDLLEQLQQVKKMGPLEKVLEMLPIPGGAKALQGADMDPGRLKRIEAVILSMTPRERRNPEIIKGSRRRRIALGSGTSVQEVNQVLKQYEQMKQIWKTLGSRGRRGGMAGLRNLFR
ncbi:MAG: signal recognition particle protein [Synergistaceae bacterium]|jgi:signal recognition particle subunit SRP54|nr:signal recognition particle protein [Synergistaceae bacterium]